MMSRFLTASAFALILPLGGWAEPGTIDADGIPIHFIDEGQGEAVIMLHSFAGTSEMWPRIGLFPLDGFRTLAFDARGHGQSGKPVDRSAYGAEMVSDVIRLMDARGIERAHIVGYSMGAETALKLATAHPDRVLSVVAAGSGWSGEEEAQVYAFVAAALGQADTFGDFMAAMAPAAEPSEEEQIVAVSRLHAHGISPDQPAAPLAAVSGGLVEIISIPADDIAAIAVPVLGVAGEHDPERSSVEALAKLVPQFSYLQIEGADHLSAPLTAEFTRAVTDFLTD